LTAPTHRKSGTGRARGQGPKVEGGSRVGGSSASERATLSRDSILRAALHVADRDGLGELTIRKIAGHLGASPMGVYRHFRNKAEIVAGLVDLVIGDYDVTNHEEPSWKEWVRETFLQMKRALYAHPGIIPLLGGTAFSGTHAFDVLERVLHVLRGAGFGDDSALLFRILMSYTIGAVAFESSALSRSAGEEELDVEERLRRRQLLFELAPRSTYPNVVASAPQLARLATDESFVAGLDRILSSVSTR
jgi:AcrR family transcriptional regulator